MMVGKTLSRDLNRTSKELKAFNTLYVGDRPYYLNRTSKELKGKADMPLIEADGNLNRTSKELKEIRINGANESFSASQSHL